MSYLVLDRSLCFVEAEQGHERHFSAGSIFQIAMDWSGEGAFEARKVAPMFGEPEPFRMADEDCFPVPRDRCIPCETWQEAIETAQRLGG